CPGTLGARNLDTMWVSRDTHMVSKFHPPRRGGLRYRIYGIEYQGEDDLRYARAEDPDLIRVCRRRARPSRRGIGQGASNRQRQSPGPQPGCTALYPEDLSHSLLEGLSGDGAEAASSARLGLRPDGSSVEK